MRDKKRGVIVRNIKRSERKRGRDSKEKGRKKREK